jgi:hypothetical protein
MKFTHTGLPRNVERSIVPPPTWATTSGGAVSPTWKPAAADPPEGDGAGALADADAEADGDVVAGDGDGVGVAVAVGVGDAAEPASGRATTSTAMASDATRTPATRPATIDRRGPTGARVAARTVPARWRGSAARLCRPMNSLLAGLRARLLPAVLTAAGVSLVVAGLLTYTDAVDLPAGSSPSATPLESASSQAPPSSSGGSPSAGTSASPDARVATRVAIPAMRIDLPVVRPPNDPKAYPWCNVAMFIKELGQPGQGRATYLYAHARSGMFLPILDASKRNNGRQMRGMLVEVWTSDDKLFLYEIVEVRRHQLDLEDAAAATTEELWLQTSEGPAGTPGKTQVIARPLSSDDAEHAVAHPKARPVDCR